MVEYIASIDSYMRRLFPICRSLTGNGNRQTLHILQELIPELRLIEYPSGIKVYDWTIPDEWNIKEAWVKDQSEILVIDFSRHNLHIVGYSIPVEGIISTDELKAHLHYKEMSPWDIPYKTSYYQKDWGFCTGKRDYDFWFQEDELWTVCIDSTLEPGSLTIGELLIPGRLSQEYLISTYICHPSMANDNLSGMVMTAFLAKELSKMNLNYSYRILFVPETLGSIAYMAHNEGVMKKIECGLVVSCVGGPERSIDYKQSWNEKHWINHVASSGLFDLWDKSNQRRGYPYDCHGSDERQYSSPDFRINMVTLSSSMYYTYPEYHTSADNLEFVSMSRINEMLNHYLRVIDNMDKNLPVSGLVSAGEPFLSNMGITDTSDIQDTELNAVLWAHHLGDCTIFDVAEKVGMPVSEVYDILKDRRLLNDGNR